MRLTRSSIRRATQASAVLTLVASALLVPSAAQAAPAPATSPEVANAASNAVAALADRLGDQIAGTYLDRSTGHMVVDVTEVAAANTVAAAGAVPRFVKHSGAQLAGVTADLGRTAKVAGTAWAVDPVTNQVVVSVDSTVAGAKLAKVRAAVAAQGDAARLERVSGTFTLRIAGGDAIYASSYRCSLGFNVTDGSAYYFLTAGHCGNLASAWYSNSSHTTRIGTRVASSFPTNDYAIIQYASGISHPGSVDLYTGSSQDIATAASAYVGESVKRSGSTTGVHSGTVTALNATVNYSEGTVYGLIRTTVCAEGGDSGGPLFSGSTALGLTSGGSGNCSSGGTTFFQPVTEALDTYGVDVY